jgi:DNA mismatch repair ATPase MutL
MLASMRILAQMNCKFFLAIVNDFDSHSNSYEISHRSSEDRGSRVLVAVDQHAADERRQLERLQKEFLKLNSPLSSVRSLNPPIFLNASTKELEISSRFDALLSSSGFSVSPSPESQGLLVSKKRLFVGFLPVVDSYGSRCMWTRFEH